MKRLVIGLTTTMLLSGSVAGVVGAGTAGAKPVPYLPFCPVPPWCP
jgi:hypothetical protein